MGLVINSSKWVHSWVLQEPKPMTGNQVPPCVFNRPSDLEGFSGLESGMGPVGEDGHTEADVGRFMLGVLMDMG